MLNLRPIDGRMYHQSRQREITLRQYIFTVSYDGSSYMRVRQLPYYIKLENNTNKILISINDRISIRQLDYELDISIALKKSRANNLIVLVMY